jgi:glycosyltransferase involved in cell wall biosynthesis
VLPYLREIQKARYLKADSADHSGREIRSSILTFEPEMSPDLGLMKKQLAEENIDLYCLPYHKRFSVIATSWDILRGAFFVRRFIARQRPDILHGRVHIATLMGALARKFSQHKPRLLFDIRGFFPEEYTDAGIWPAGGFLYWWAKRVERWLMTEADGFVVLTEKAREILFPESLESGFDRKGRPVEVIPCCVNLKMFGVDRSAYRDQIRMKIGAGNRPIVVYVGSFGGWYLSSSMINFFSAAREVDPETFVLILTQRDKENVKERLVKAGFDSDDFFVESVEPAEIPKFLAAADIAVSFIKACYSKQSSSPTKIAEYLASGLPVIANEGVGDVDDLIRERKVGHILQGLAPEDYKRAIEEIKGLSDVQDRCRALASTEFDLEQVGGARYRSIYENLLNGREKRP